MSVLYGHDSFRMAFVREKKYRNEGLSARAGFAVHIMEKMAAEMTDIIAIMDTVKEIDVTYDAMADNKNIYLNDLREDIHQESFPTEKILQNAVNDENCFVVPKVVE